MPSWTRIVGFKVAKACPGLNRRYRFGVALPFLTLFFCLTGGGNSLHASPIENFEVTVEGVADKMLLKSILEISGLTESRQIQQPTDAALARLVQSSFSRIDQLLRSRGYYSSTIAQKIEGTGSTRTVRLTIAPGPVYRLLRYEIGVNLPPAELKRLDITFAVLGITAGDVAEAEKIVAAESNLLAAYSRRGYPLANRTNQKIVVDHATRGVTALIDLDAGPLARFGEVIINGLTTLDDQTVTDRILWRKGEIFDSRLVAETRTKLRETGLFGSVTVSNSDAVQPDGGLPLTITVVERKHRSVGLGAAYSTSDGPLGRAFWETRNLFGGGERLRLKTEVGEVRTGAFADFRAPNFGALDQDLVIDSRVTEETPDGFESFETAVIARIEKKLSPIYAGSVGLGFERSSVTQTEVERDFNFIITPLTLTRDTSDDLLDPSSGARTRLTIGPNFGVVGTDSNFISARLFDSAFLPLLPEKRLTLAGWFRIATILGETTGDIPANKRLYSGGAGSVRGYALNAIGPQDNQKEPIGGRSLTEFGGELRWRVKDPFGLVGFVEAGNVYDTSVPKWGDNLRWAAGVGVRYLTVIGPLRLDVAMPIGRRNEDDASFQILVSLGQAF